MSRLKREPEIAGPPPSPRAPAAEELFSAREAVAEAETLNEVARTLAVEFDLQRLLQKVTDLSRTATRASFGAFFYTTEDEDGGSFLLYTLSGAPREAFEKFGTPRNTPLFGPTFRGEGPVRIADVLADPRYGKFAPHHGMPKGHLPVRSYLAVPVVSRTGGVLGGLFFGHPEVDVFTERAERLATAIAAQAAMAIENATLYERAQREFAERSRAEAAVRESEQRLLIALESGRMGTWEWDTSTGRVDWSTSLELLHGREPGSFNGTMESALSDVHPDDRTKVKRAIDMALEGGDDYHVEYRILTPSAEERWLEARGQVFRDADGNPQRMAGICSDVSQRRLAYQTRSHLAAIVQSSNDAIIGMSLDGIITSWNAAARSIFGYSSDETVGHPVTMLIPRERQGEEQEILERIRRGEPTTHFETERLTKDGRRIDISLTVSPIRDHADQIVGASKVARDITDARRAQAALEASEARYRQLVHGLPAAVYACDAEGRVTLFNEAAAELWGRRPEIGKDLWCGSFTIYYPDGRRMPLDECPMARTLFTGQPVVGEEIVVERPDGMRKRVLPNPHPIHDPSGKLVGAVNMLIDLTDIRETEQALLVSEQRFRAVTLNAPVAIFIKDVEGRYTLANPLACKVLGFPDGIAGKTDYDFLPKKFADEIRRNDREVLETGDTIEREETILSRGQLREFLTVKFPLRRPDGEIEGICGVGMDITARKSAEHALRESEDRFRTLADNISQFAWMTDESGAIFWYNQRWFEYTGTTADEMQGWGWKSVHHPDHLQRVVEKYTAAIRRGESWEDTFPIRGADGAYRWFLSRAHPIRDPQGRVVRWFGTNTDITELRKADEALRESESRFRTMADSAPSLIWLADKEMNRTWCNQPWLEFTGRTMESELGDRWMRHVHPDDINRCRQAYAEARKSRSRLRVEYRMLRQDGEYRWILDHGVPLTAGSGRLEGFVGYCEDMTEEVMARAALQDQQNALEEAVRLRTQELDESHRRLRISERMASIGTLSAGLGHDMANILLPIRLRLEAIEALDVGHSASDEIADIRSAVEYLQSLSSGLRMLVVDPDNRKGDDRTELGHWWNHASTVIRSAVPGSVRLEGTMPGEACWVRISRAALTQIVFNLVQNSIDALRARGSGTVEISAARVNGEVELTVRDDGPGMDPEILEKCLQPFFSTKTRGMSTGLGLALVYGMVQEAGGNVQIESSRGTGTSVILTLLATDAPHTGPAQPPRPADVRVAHPRVRAIVVRELSDLGFAIVEDGEDHEAMLRVWDHQPATSGRENDSTPTVVLADGDGGERQPGVSEIRRKIRAAVSSMQNHGADEAGTVGRTPVSG